MSQARSNPIPLPAAVLALSVAVCIGSVGAAGASPLMLERACQAEQRQTIEHLLDAIQQAARTLTDRLVGQAAHADRATFRLSLDVQSLSHPSAQALLPAVCLLRDALLNLPPPTR